MATPLTTSNRKPISYDCRTVSSSSSTTITSLLIKQVFLHEWWLINSNVCSNKKQLGVAGFNSRGRQGLRVFHSAPIVKRLDTVTVETSDGITITVCGLINISRTLENGFPSEICNHFLNGFPYYWEEISSVDYSERLMDEVVPQWTRSLFESTVSSDNELNGHMPVSFEDLPATAICDLLMSTLGDPGRTKAGQGENSDYVMSNATPSRKNTERQKKKHDATSGATASNNKKCKVVEKHKGDGACSDASAARNEITKTEQKKNRDIVGHVSEATAKECEKNEVKLKDKAGHAESVAVNKVVSCCSSTRNMTRLTKSRNKLGEDQLDSSPITSGVNASEGTALRRSSRLLTKYLNVCYANLSFGTPPAIKEKSTCGGSDDS